MKKMFVVLLASVFALGLAACGGGSDETSTSQDSTGDGTQSITAWAWDPNFNIRALDVASDIFTDVNPDVNVNIVENAQDSIIQQLNIMLSSNTTTGLPNVVLIEDYRAQVFLQAFSGAFYDMSDYIDSDQFAQYKIPMTSFEGRQYGVPFDTGVVGTFVRTDILEQAGFSLDDVSDIDWDEFIDIAIEVQNATGKKLMTLDPSDLGLIRMMLQTTGSWYTEPDGTTPNIANNEDLKIAFGVFKRLIDEDLIIPVTDWSQFVGAFNTGDVWAVPTGNWILASITAEESQSGNWGVAPQLSLPGVASSVNASNLGGSSWYVLNIDGKEAAAEFLASTFGSSTQLYERLLDDIGAMGTFTPASDNPNMQAEVEFFGGQRVFSDFSRWVEEIPEVNYGLHTYAIEDILAVAMQSYLAGQDLDQVLQTAQAQADSQLN